MDIRIPHRLHLGQGLARVRILGWIWDLARIRVGVLEVLVKCKVYLGIGLHMDW